MKKCYWLLIRVVACIILLITNIQAKAQEISITGKVTSQKNGEELPGVGVTVKKNKSSTMTDAFGNFSILAKPGDVLVFSYLGFLTKEVSLGTSVSKLKVEIEEDVKSLDEIVVVGYGTQRKSDVSGAIVSVKAEDMKGIPTRSIAEMLRGKAPGVAVTTSSARPGGTSDIIIRGQKSLTGGNAPLYVIDNVPADASIANDINAEDIASVEVLKDASSQAIYGARAANGVILITTKRGVANKVAVSYSGYGGVQKLKKNFDLYNAQEWAQLTREAYRTENPTGEYGDDAVVFDAFILERLKSNQEINWQDFMIRNAAIQKHDVSIRGGSEKTKVAASIGYLNQNGMVEGSGFERGTARINVDQDISKKVKIGANFAYTRNFQTQEDGSLNEYIIVTPLAKPYDDNGNLQLWVDQAKSITNPKFLNQQTVNEGRSNRMLLNFFGTVNLFKGFTYRLNTNINTSNKEAGEYRTNLYQKGSNIGSKAKISSSDNLEYLVENIFNYDKEINKNNRFDLTFVQSINKDQQKTFSISGSQLPNDLLGYNGIASAKLQDVPSRDIKERALLSYMGRIRYTFMDKYLFTVTARVDGSSVFGSEEKYGLFPSASFAWRLEQEDFIKQYNWISQLKLRLNYGSVGNQAVDPYTTLGEVNSYPMLFADGTYTIGYLPNNTLSNPYLKWETTTSANIGIDYGFLNGRISGAIDFYKSNTTDILVKKSINQSLGYTGMWTNIGEVENKGVELLLSGTPIQKGDFRWNIDFTFARNKNKLLKLDGTVDENGKPVNDISNNWFINEEIGAYYNYIFDGIWQSDDDILNSHMPNAKPGDIRVKDINQDGKIDLEDREIIRKQPKWVGSFGTTFKYKGFDLLFDFYTVQGAVKSNNYLYSFNEGGSLTGKNNGIKVNYWTPENPSNEFPRPRQNSSINYFSSLSYQDASYIRLRTATFGYAFPKTITNKMKIQNLRVYVTGNNIFTKTNYSSYSPENTPGSYPEPKMFLFGLNLTL